MGGQSPRAEGQAGGRAQGQRLEPGQVQTRCRELPARPRWERVMQSDPQALASGGPSCLCGVLAGRTPVLAPRLTLLLRPQKDGFYTSHRKAVRSSLAPSSCCWASRPGGGNSVCNQPALASTSHTAL